ncbi:MAG TPA: hypothetical protein VGQ83_04225 [Polyangia bacterium]
MSGRPVLAVAVACAVLAAAALAGIRYLWGSTQTAYDEYEDAAHVCVTLTTGLDMTHWFARHFGLTVRALAGVVIPVHQTAGVHARFDAGFDFGVAVGLAF